tara:strand:+ start:1357 stop:1677 length:321 start_codon:yes stop_codon:yes gene_type:complete
MGWWPFAKKEKSFQDGPHIRGGKFWIQELRELCERSFNSRSEGQISVKRIRSEWKNSHAQGELEDSTLEGLERRAEKLLEADDNEWSRILDDDGFWIPGWGSKMEE